MLTWTSKSWEDFTLLGDNKTIRKVIKLIKDIKRNGYTGIGKPEPLRGDFSGYWSRRINSKDRIVYKIEGDDIIIVQCGTHYGDK